MKPGDTKERSVAQLLSDLSRETSQLVHQEVELAKAEMTEKLNQAMAGGRAIAIAAVVALLTLGALTAFLIAVLATVMPVWLSALIVTVVYAAIGWFFVSTAQHKFKQASPPVPKQTIETVKEDVKWAKAPTKSATR